MVDCSRRPKTTLHVPETQERSGELQHSALLVHASLRVKHGGGDGGADGGDCGGSKGSFSYVEYSPPTNELHVPLYRAQ